MIALPPGNEMPAFRLADLDVILPRQFDGGLHRFRTTRHEIGVAQPLGRAGNEMIRQPLGGIRGEGGGMHVGDLIELRLHRRGDSRMAMPEARHRRATRGIDIGTPGRIDDLDAARPRHRRRRAIGGCLPRQRLPVKDTRGAIAHGIARHGRVRWEHKPRSVERREFRRKS